MANERNWLAWFVRRMVVMLALWIALAAQPEPAPWPIYTAEGMAYIKADGTPAFAAQFDQAGEFSEGLAPVVADGRAGFIDLSGRVVLTFPATRTGNFREGLAAVINGGSVAYVDKTGTVKVPPRYRIFPTGDREWGDFREGKVCVLMEGGYGFVDTQGQVVVKGILQEPSEFSEGLAMAKTAEGNGYIDETGELVISGYEPLGRFSEGLAPVRSATGVGFIDKEGVMQLGGTWQAAGPFDNGRAWVVANGKLGFIDKRGVFVIPARYGYSVHAPSAGVFRDGLAWVIEATEEGQSAYIKSSGVLAFPMKFDYATDFRDGRAYVQIGEDQALIDTEGRVIWRAPFDVSFRDGAF